MEGAPPHAAPHHIPRQGEAGQGIPTTINNTPVREVLYITSHHITSRNTSHHHTLYHPVLAEIFCYHLSIVCVVFFRSFLHVLSLLVEIPHILQIDDCVAIILYYAML